MCETGIFVWGVITLGLCAFIGTVAWLQGGRVAERHWKCEAVTNGHGEIDQQGIFKWRKPCPPAA